MIHQENSLGGCEPTRSLQPDEMPHVHQTPKKGIGALQHQEHRRRVFRQNSRALRTAALERARHVISGDLHEDENREVRTLCASLLSDYSHPLQLAEA